MAGRGESLDMKLPINERELTRERKDLHVHGYMYEYVCLLSFHYLEGELSLFFLFTCHIFNVHL